MKSNLLVIQFLLFCLLFCCKREVTPVEKVKVQIEEIKEYVNKRQIGKVMEYISDDYKDVYGNRKDSLKAILIQNLLFKKGVKVTIKNIDVQITDNNAIVYISVFAKEGEGIIPNNADLIDIELKLIRLNGRWLITSARWKSPS